MTRAGIGDERHDTVCREDGPETPVTEREPGSVALQQGEGDARGAVDCGALAHHTHGEVGGDQVDAVPAQPAPALAGAAADLQDRSGREVAGSAGEHAEFGLGPALGAPHELGIAEEVPVVGVIVDRLGVPPPSLSRDRLRLVDVRAADVRHTAYCRVSPF
jgi:hypothetical protein